MYFFEIYCIVISIENEIKADVSATTLHTQFLLWEWRWCYMVEQAMLMIMYLLFYGLVGITIIAFALIIAIVVILSK